MSENYLDKPQKPEDENYTFESVDPSGNKIKQDLLLGDKTLKEMKEEEKNLLID